MNRYHLVVLVEDTDNQKFQAIQQLATDLLNADVMIASVKIFKASEMTPLQYHLPLPPFPPLADSRI